VAARRGAFRAAPPTSCSRRMRVLKA
jgi:hypothetical protein